MSHRVRTGSGREPAKNPRPKSMIKDVFWLLVNVPAEQALTKKEIWERMGSPLNVEGEPLSTPGACVSKLKNEKALFKVSGSRPQRFYGVPTATDYAGAQDRKIRAILSEDEQEACWIYRDVKPPTAKEPEEEIPVVGMFGEDSEGEKAEEPEPAPEPVCHKGETTAPAREKTLRMLGCLPRCHYYAPEEIAEKLGFTENHVSTNLSFLYLNGRRVMRKKVGRKFHYAFPFVEPEVKDEELEAKNEELALVEGQILDLLKHADDLNRALTTIRASIDYLRQRMRVLQGD